MSGKLELSVLQKQLIKDYTLLCYPEEMCGFLTEDSFIPLENIHENPTKHFRPSPVEYAKALPFAKALVHSHTRNPRREVIFDSRTPSYNDTKGQALSNLPWLIVDTQGTEVGEPLQYPRVPNRDYEGRSFIWFINDCYTLIQDWYLFELGIALPNYKLSQDYTDIRHLNDLFEPYIEEYGFVETSIDKLKRGDLLLLDHAGFTRNHLGVYDGKNVLHQDMISVIVPFETFYGRINKVLTYVG